MGRRVFGRSRSGLSRTRANRRVLGSVASGATAAPSETWLFLVDINFKEILAYSVDTDTLTIVADIDGGKNPFDVAADPSGNLYVACQNGEIRKLAYNGGARGSSDSYTDALFHSTGAECYGVAVGSAFHGGSLQAALWYAQGPSAAQGRLEYRLLDNTAGADDVFVTTSANVRGLQVAARTGEDIALVAFRDANAGSESIVKAYEADGTQVAPTFTYAGTAQPYGAALNATAGYSTNDSDKTIARWVRSGGAENKTWVTGTGSGGNGLTRPLYIAVRADDTELFVVDYASSGSTGGVRKVTVADQSVSSVLTRNSLWGMAILET